MLCFMLMGATLWFVGLQLFALKTMGPFCMAAHACGLAASGLLLVLARTPQTTALQGKTKPPAVRAPEPPITKLAVAGLAGVAVLIAGQLLYVRPSYAVKSLAGASQAVPPKPVERNYTLHNASSY